MAQLQSLILTCVALLVVSVTVEASTPRMGWQAYHQGHYYFFSNESLSWLDARDACAEQGGHLVEIESSAEQTFLNGVIAQIPGGANYWIGLNDRDQESQHVWENTGRTGFYTNWHSNEPNNTGEEDCVELFTSQWNDLACHWLRQYICEMYISEDK